MEEVKYIRGDEEGELKFEETTVPLSKRLKGWQTEMIEELKEEQIQKKLEDKGW